VRRLRTHGAVVVVGTCPDLGVIPAIPQPLRSLAHARTSQLARAQAAAVKAAGGVPVPLAQKLAPQFRAAPEVMFSADGYHPSPVAYALAAEALLVTLSEALGGAVEGPAPAPPPEPPLAPASQVTAMSRLWRRQAADSPASYQPVGSD